jgi:Holliday junction DNA helicase RuvB
VSSYQKSPFSEYFLEAPMSGTETVVATNDVTELEVPRPSSLQEFNGQSAIKENLEVYIRSARIRSAALDHLLFHGPPGLGKTTLSQIISKELGVNMRQVTGPAVQKPADIVTILVGLEERDVLFIDEVHRIPAPVAEMLYVAMEDYRLDLLVGEEGQGRAVSIPLPRFTLIGATTHRGKLADALSQRFEIQFALELYTEAELVHVVTRAARMLDLHMDQGAVNEVARCARGTPRIALGLMNRLRDFALVDEVEAIDFSFVRRCLDRQGIDQEGLNPTDRRYLKLLKETLRPIGLKTLASALSEPEESLETKVEPYLLRRGLITITDRGRTLSKQMRNPFTQAKLDL